MARLTWWAVAISALERAGADGDRDGALAVGEEVEPATGGVPARVLPGLGNPVDEASRHLR